MNQYGMNFGMPNMPMQMQGGNMFMNMNMNNMNNMMANNPVEDEEWIKGFTLGVQEVASSNQEEEEDDGSPKINCIFTINVLNSPLLYSEFENLNNKILSININGTEISYCVNKTEAKQIERQKKSDEDEEENEEEEDISNYFSVVNILMLQTIYIIFLLIKF